MKKYLPNTITLINLFCGCAATVSVLYGDFLSGFWFLFVGGWADYLDGMVARWLRVNSVLGKELDSMADVVSFGVAPGAILYMLLSLGFHPNVALDELPYQLNIGALPGFLVSVFAGLRLARFNLDERQTDDFIGLATPSMTLFVVGLMVIYYNNSLGLAEWIISPYFLYPVIGIFSLLMVSPLPMFSFKFKGKQWRGNEWRYSFIIVMLLMLGLLREASFAFIVLAYLVFALSRIVIRRMKQKE